MWCVRSSIKVFRSSMIVFRCCSIHPKFSCGWWWILILTFLLFCDFYSEMRANCKNHKKFLILRLSWSSHVRICMCTNIPKLGIRRPQYNLNERTIFFKWARSNLKGPRQIFLKRFFSTETTKMYANSKTWWAVK